MFVTTCKWWNMDTSLHIFFSVTSVLDNVEQNLFVYFYKANSDKVILNSRDICAGRPLCTHSPLLQIVLDSCQLGYMKLIPFLCKDNK